MKKLALLLLCLPGVLLAQQKTESNDAPTSQRAQGVYFEGLGNGGLYALNYDIRFGPHQGGLGGRIGLSFYANRHDRYFAAPLAVNYLAGKKGKYFEVGAGLTFYSANISPIFIDRDQENITELFGTLTFGYRSQPLEGGFMFRGGVSPITSKEAFVPFGPYLSFGYSF